LRRQKSSPKSSMVRKRRTRSSDNRSDAIKARLAVQSWIKPCEIYSPLPSRSERRDRIDWWGLWSCSQMTDVVVAEFSQIRSVSVLLPPIQPPAEPPLAGDMDGRSRTVSCHRMATVCQVLRLWRSNEQFEGDQRTLIWSRGIRQKDNRGRKSCALSHTHLLNSLCDEYAREIRPVFKSRRNC
jgi:hypothetical protein